VSQAWEFFDRMPAVPVFAIDADGIVGRPGPRLVDGRRKSGTGPGALDVLQRFSEGADGYHFQPLWSVPPVPPHHRLGIAGER
jgi:hypothetical protein